MRQTGVPNGVRALRSVAVQAALLLALCGFCGCRSRWITTNVVNATGGDISAVEVDYPSASFGTNTLAAGAGYPYRFEIIGSGPLKAIWTDAARKTHTANGPSLHEGQSGTLTVTLGHGDTANWQFAER